MTQRADTPCPQEAALVVVDLQQLASAEPIARCAPVDGASIDGAQALEAAGFAITGTTRFGRSFICRIDDRPSARERLDYHGRDGYRESCVGTPPPGAYWSYWSAEPGSCEWQFSSTGAASHEVTAGSAEAWSFALDTSPTNAPKPRVGPCDAVVTAVPSNASANAAADTSATTGRIDPLVGMLLLAVLVGGIIAAAVHRRRRAHRQPNLDRDA